MPASQPEPLLLGSCDREQLAPSVGPQDPSANPALICSRDTGEQAGGRAAVGVLRRWVPAQHREARRDGQTWLSLAAGALLQRFCSFQIF